MVIADWCVLHNKPGPIFQFAEEIPANGYLFLRRRLMVILPNLSVYRSNSNSSGLSREIFFLVFGKNSISCK